MTRQARWHTGTRTDAEKVDIHFSRQGTDRRANIAHIRQSRANVAHIRQSRPHFGPGFQEQFSKTFCSLVHTGTRTLTYQFVKLFPFCFKVVAFCIPARTRRRSMCSSRVVADEGTDRPHGDTFPKCSCSPNRRSQILDVH